MMTKRLIVTSLFLFSSMIVAQPLTYRGALSADDANAILFLVDSGQVDTVVLDLDGVLLETDTRAVVRELSLIEKFWMALWTLTHLRKPDKHFLFSTFRAIAPNYASEEQHVYNEDLLLPPFMCQWQAGDFNSASARDSATAAITQGRARKQITHCDVRVLHAMSRLAFDTESFGRTRAVVPAGQYLLERLSERRAGKPHLKVALLTNFAADAFVVVQNAFPQIFRHFHEDHIFISSELETVKPHERSYQAVLRGLRANPETTLMVDDEPHNVEGALNTFNYAYLTRDRAYESVELPRLAIRTQ